MELVALDRRVRPNTATWTPDVYFVHVDRALSRPGLTAVPFDHTKLRAALFLYALLYDSIVIPDGATIYNAVLRDLLLGPEYTRFGVEQLLRDEIVEFAQRDNAPSFEQLEQTLRRDGAWGVTEPGQIEPYLEYLDRLNPKRRPYSYDDAATRFTTGIGSSLENDVLMQRLGLGEIAEAAAIHEAAARGAVEDGYARRSSLYRFADELGEPSPAARLRELASLVYHESAATALNLDPTYPAQFSACVEAVHGLPLKAIPGQASSPEDVVKLGLAFPFEAMAKIDYRVIHDIRRSSRFGSWLSEVRQCREESDTAKAAERFMAALSDHLASLDGPLMHAIYGRYARQRSLKTGATIVRWGSRGLSASSLVVGLVGGNPVLGLSASAFWLFGPWSVSHWIESHQRAEDFDARAAKIRGRLAPIVHASTVSTGTSGDQTAS